MEALTLKEIAQAVGGTTGGCGASHLRVSAISTDTRTLSSGSSNSSGSSDPAGDLFVAISGPRFDGHDFLEEAVAKGAAALLVRKGEAERAAKLAATVVVDDTLSAFLDLGAHYRQKLSPRVAAITGTNGKTTTKDLLGLALATAGETVWSERSYNNFIGVPLTLFRITQHTRYAVLEIGTNAPGEIKQLTATARPEIGAVTNVSHAHLQGLESLAGVAQEKADLLRGLPRDGIAVLNRDDPSFPLLSDAAACNVITFGVARAADYQATEIKSLPAATARRSDQDGPVRAAGGLTFTVRGTELCLPVIGLHNVYNALCAFACARELGANEESVAAAFREFSGTAMRLEPVQAGSLLIINDAYNANPASVAAALRAFAHHRAAGRKLVVLGDMLELGEDSRELHRKVGAELACGEFDCITAVGECALDYVAGAVSSGVEPDRLRVFADVDEALKRFPALVEEGDSILVKGSRAMGLERLTDALAALESTGSNGQGTEYTTGTVS